MKLPIALFLFALSFPVFATHWPLPDDVRPTTAIQSWKYNGSKVDFNDEGKQKVLNATGNNIGYKNIVKNTSIACGSSSCKSSSGYILGEEPNFTHPEGAKELVKSRGNKYILDGGIFYSSSELKLESSDKLEVTAPSTLYVPKLTIDKGKITNNVTNSTNDSFVIVVNGDTTINDAKTINAHILSKKDAQIKGSTPGNYTTINGTVTAHFLKLDSYAKINGVIPKPDEPDPPLPTSKFDFGVAKCSGLDAGGVCQITFNAVFDRTPLVFLMPTVNTSSPDADRPSTLRLSSVSTTGATFEQQFSVPDTYTKYGMTEVSYFAMEPGKAVVTDSDSGESVVIQAGTKNIKTAVAKGDNDDDSWEEVEFAHEYDDDLEPVVLTEIQTQNNDDVWFTTAVDDIEEDEFDLALERSHLSIRYKDDDDDDEQDYVNEQVAYLAAPPLTAELDGRKFQFAADFSTKRTGGSKTPLTDACAALKALEHNYGGIVANKQQRKGSDGGWLRRCQLGESKVSFVVDENAQKRPHTSEKVGYVAFDYFDTEIDKDLICRYFPEPTQSWNITSEQKYSDTNLSAFNIRNSSPRITGWSDEYRARYTIDNHSQWPNLDLLRVGYDTHPDPWQIYANPICSPTGCDTGDADGLLSQRKIKEPELLSEVFPSNKSVSITDSTTENFYGDVCGLGSSVCSYQENADGTVELTMMSSLKALDVRSRGNRSEIIVKFNSGIAIESVYAETNVNLYFKANSTVRIGSLTMSNTGLAMSFEPKTRINVVSSMAFNNPIEFRYMHGAIDPIIYGPLATIAINSTNNEVFNGFILGKEVSFRNPLEINGSVTAHKLEIHNATTIAKPNYSCEMPPVTTKKLKVKILDTLNLTCEQADIEFEVVDSDGNRVVTENSSFTVKRVGSGGQWCDSGTCTANAEYTAQLVNGYKKLQISSSGTANSYQIETTWSGDTENDNSDIVFVPFKFDAPDVYAISGMSTKNSIKVLACNDGSSRVVSNYSNTPNVSFSVVKPLSTAGGNNGSLDFTPSFSAGEAKDVPLTLSESGEFTVVLEDSDFSCEGIAGCPIDGAGKLRGTFDIMASPWKLALCSPNGNSWSGNATSGSGFKAAKELFTVEVKPIAYDKDRSPTVSEGYCGYPVTSNFTHQDAWAATVDISHTIATPSNGVTGDALTGTTSNTVGGGVSGSLSYAGLSVSEVGSFNFVAQLVGSSVYNTIHANVLGVNSKLIGEREIGRFYPYQIQIVSNDWNYAAGHDNFAYLDQPISVDFVAQAQAKPDEEGVAGTPTLNYSGFLEGFNKLGLKPFAADNTGTKDLDSRMLATWTSANWTGANNQAYTQDFTYLRSVTQTSPQKVTEVDGPFGAGNLMIGLKFSSGMADPTKWLSVDSTVHQGQKFPTALTARYGRLSLTDVGGNTSQSITVPLQAEYWNGTEFTTNTEDSGSEFYGEAYCVQGVWPDLASSASLTTQNSTRTVSGGLPKDSAEALLAVQSSSEREQVRLWLRSDNAIPNGLSESTHCKVGAKVQPWLNFNWRNQGDEIPSAVVTFGTHRGNDRVIFRGEARMTGR
ncbi:DUF6701 domain-containing protein [Vibrio sp. SCSIO 43136]|uniref:DUF6701 domain-containing protein n=1 Tax=Vibrio sp. SCSIO 43136 TaxID=2819101 RepID=UPI0020751D28|nr:DUF6701 domain-containing protein [Vibrio sp. SCSIO 43136]USD65012.1 hypothetical protein J4N39_13185 [Vibrio sp. SCSIO 43136]